MTSPGYLVRRTLGAAAPLGLAAAARAGPASPAESEAGLPGVADSFYGYVRHTFELDSVRCYVVMHARWQGKAVDRAPDSRPSALRTSPCSSGYHLAYTDVAGLFGSPKAVERLTGSTNT